MKKLLSALLLLALLAALLPSAWADAPKVAAVYAAPDADDAGDENPAPIVLYVYEDGTYRRYALLDGGAELTGEGVFDVNENPDLICIYPQEAPAPDPTPEPVVPAPAPAGEEPLTYDEGVDTPVEITGYTPWDGAPAGYFPQAGDRVAVISPSALPGREQTDAVMAGLRAWGFEPVEGKHVCPETRTLEECIEDLKWALEDPDIKAIFCVRGGYGSTEVMDLLPLEQIASANKPIIGYSDITVYHAAWTSAGLPSLHACMSGAFDDFPEACAEAERRLMTGEAPAYRCAADAFCREGTAEGVLIGGNLSTFTAALGTAYDCTKLDRPYILFLEEVGENMQHIHRYLTILKHAGVLDRAAGIVFGEWTELPADGMGNYGEARGGLFDSVAEMIDRQFLDGAEIPVAFGFPAGHGPVNYPLLMGAEVRLEVSADSYTLTWPDEA